MSVAPLFDSIEDLDPEAERSLPTRMSGHPGKLSRILKTGVTSSITSKLFAD